MTTFLQLVVSGLSSGAAYALVGIGLVLIFRTTGVLNFAQGSFAVIGGLTTTSLVERMPTLAAAVLAIGFTAAVGTAMAPLALGFRARTTMLSSLIVTIGLALVVEAAVLWRWGDTPKTYPAISGGAWNVGGVLILPQYALVVGVTLVTTVLLVLLLRRTIIGNALVACADAPRAAEVVGLNVRRLGLVVFGLSAGLGALAGVLLIPLTPMTYESDVAIAVLGFAAASFGGLVSVGAALAGGFSLGVAESLVAGYIDPQYRLAIALVILLVIIFWRSRGEVEA